MGNPPFQDVFPIKYGWLSIYCSHLSCPGCMYYIYMYIISYICTFPQTRRSFTERSGEPFSWSFKFSHGLCVFCVHHPLDIGPWHLPPDNFVCITAKVTPTTQTSMKWPYFLGGVSLVTRCWLTSQHLTETPGLGRNPKKQRHLEHASLERYHRGTPGVNFRGGFHGTTCACFWLLFLPEFWRIPFWTISASFLLVECEHEICNVCLFSFCLLLLCG